MRRLESLIHLPQPPFEEGKKTHGQVAMRRIARLPLIASHTPEVADRVCAPFLSPEMRHLKAKLNQELDSPDPEKALIRNNTLFLPSQIFLRASPFHLDNWLRDSFVTCLALNNPEIEKHLLDHFVKRENKEGQLPTTRFFIGDRAWYFDDESTALALVWRAKIAEMGLPMTQNERETWREIRNWILSHVKDGFYITPAGTERSWFDTFVYREPDIITYNQGVYVASMIAADKLGIPIGKDRVQKAIEAYNQLIDKTGRLKLSENVPYKDVSALFGEFLCNILWDESVLDRKIIKRTIESLEGDRWGYKVVTKPDGSYLDSGDFKRPYQPGDYHNGAEWPLFGTIVQFVAYFHSLPYDRAYLIGRLRLLHEINNAEYINTDGAEGDRPRYNHQRINHAWNAAVYELVRRVIGDQPYQSELWDLNQPKVLFYSEASQLPGSTL